MISFFDSDIRKIVNPRYIIFFEKLCIKTYRDLIFHLPNYYLNRTISPKISEIIDNQLVTLILKIQKIDMNLHSRKPTKIIACNSSGFVNILYFNRIPTYILRDVFIGNEIVVSGIANVKNGEVYMSHPDIFSHVSNREKVFVIEPVYRKVSGLTSKIIHKNILNVLSKFDFVDEWIPQELLHRKNWYGFKESLLNIHSPKDFKKIQSSIDRLSFDEALSHKISLRIVRDKIRKIRKKERKFSGNLVNLFLKNLDFALTDEQKLVLKDITDDQLSDKKMLRLLMGDVGCGKTIIAICAALNAKESGMQIAFMAPTEVLSSQHYNNIKKFLIKFEFNIQLLTSNCTKKEKSYITKGLAMGEVDFVIGTHSLFQEGIEFQNLGLVIIDEQHKFGVLQRLKLMEKSYDADLLMLSATPIPRSLNIVNHGDMDISVIKNKPFLESDIETFVIPKSKQNQIISRMNNIIINNKKAFWVCPLINESEKLMLSHVNSVAKELIGVLGEKIAILHGSMSLEEKNISLKEFQTGSKNILVATSIIEVGLDIPDATVIVIDNAERFGLSQLHQLRGRVGRNNNKAFCILLHNEKISSTARQRLMVIKNHKDGFSIAKRDLEIRGAGDYLGINQTGDVLFKILTKNSNFIEIVELTDTVKNIKNQNTLLKIFNKQVNDIAFV